MKKTLLIVLAGLSILAIQGSSFGVKAETTEIWLGDIIFEEKELTVIEHGFLINDLGYTLIKLHLVIAGKDLQLANYQWEALEVIKKLEQLTKQDIIETLYLAEDKQVALGKYLVECSNELQKWDTIAAYMKQEMEIIKSDREACITEKEISDREYFDAIERYDQNIMDTSLADSIKHEQCATEKRIQYNAKSEVLKKIVFYLGLLQKKYDMLFAKQDIVAKTFDIFKENLLPDLNEIDEVLKQYEF